VVANTLRHTALPRNLLEGGNRHPGDPGLAWLCKLERDGFTPRLAPNDPKCQPARLHLLVSRRLGRVNPAPMAPPQTGRSRISRAHGATIAGPTPDTELPQLKVMSCIETCRDAALWAVAALYASATIKHVAYNSCRNRHCPKVQGGANGAGPGCRRAWKIVAGEYSTWFLLCSTDRGHRVSEQGKRSMVCCSRCRPKRC